MALALARNYDPFAAPEYFPLHALYKKFDKSFGVTGRDYGKVSGDRTREDIERRENERMAKLYRKHILKEPDQPELVQLQPAAPKPVEEREAVGSFGD